MALHGLDEAQRVLDKHWPAGLGTPVARAVLSGFISELVVEVTVEFGASQPRKLVAKITRDSDRFAGASEARLMRTWSNKGLAPAVVATTSRLIVTDWVHGAPAELKDLNVAAELLGHCHSVPSPGLPELHDLLVQRFGALAMPGDIESVDGAVMNNAEQLLSQIGPTKQSSLHADCHQRNVIVNHDRAVVIDPLGAVGDASFDLAMLALTVSEHPFSALRTLRGAYAGDTETLGAWFAWLAAFRWRVDYRQRPASAQRIHAVLRKLAADPRWWHAGGD